MVCQRTLLSLAVILCAGAAQAGSYENTIQHEILPGWQEEDGAHIAALQVTLSPGWKTYWRAPGEAGIPPLFDWSGSENLKSVGYIWPTPEVFDSGGLQTIGYKGSMTLPIKLVPSDPALPIILRGQVDMGVCEEICMPVTLPFSAALPTGGKHNPLISSAIAARPFTEAEGRVSDVSCELVTTDFGLQLDAEVRMPSAGGTEIAVVEVPNPDLWVDPAVSNRQGDTLHVRTALTPISGRAVAFDRSSVTFTVIGKDYAVEVNGCD